MNLKTDAEIAIMAEGGKHLGAILEQLLDAVAVGVTPFEIDTLAQKLIQKTGGSPSFMTVNDYKWATCISVNEGVVHGIPNKVPFTEGDVVSVDVGLLLNGYHTDTSWTKYLKPKQPTPETQAVEQFLAVGKKALQAAIASATVGHRIGHISQTIQRIVESSGYKVIRSLVGHSIGKSLHETPQVPGVLTRPIDKTVLLQPNMALAIEVIYSMGTADIVYANDDGWSLSTADGSIAGLYEQTIVTTDKRPIVLTRSSQAPQGKFKHREI